MQYLKRRAFAMKLQKQKTREVKGKEYYRWAIVLPPDKIEETNWSEGDELETEVREGEIILRKAFSRKT